MCNIYRGTCAGTALIDSVVNACSSVKNRTACEADKLCRWTSDGTSCVRIADDTSIMFQTASGGKDISILQACSAATNQTECTAQGAKNTLTFEDAKVVEMAAFVQSTGGQAPDTPKNTSNKIAAAVHHMLLAFVAALLLLLG